MGDQVGNHGIMGRFGGDFDLLNEQVDELPRNRLDLVPQPGQQTEHRTTSQEVPGIHWLSPWYTFTRLRRRLRAPAVGFRWREVVPIKERGARVEWVRPGG
jgi:hypothetical protein